MAVDTTQTLELSKNPIEIVATLNLSPGEYRIENASAPAGTIGSRIFFVASAQILSKVPDAGHTLPPGGREDISIEPGQKYYFWSEVQQGYLVLTRAEAGGAISGGKGNTREHNFYVSIYQTSATRIVHSPVGGTYNLDTDVLTPPAGWSVTVPTRDLNLDETRYTCRALINPNDVNRLITPTWLGVHLLGEAGTITQISTDPPLTGGAEYGDVTLGVADRGIVNAKVADDAIDLRTLKGGTPDKLLGFNATTGDPEEVDKNTRLTDFDVPDYSGNKDKILSLPASETAPVWRNEQTIPYDFKLSVTGSAPGNPTATDVWFADRDFSGAVNVTERDASTPRSSGLKGDVYTYDGTNWVFQGSINTMYELASNLRAGLMAIADKIKLDGIQAGAEVNPGPATTTTDGLMSAADKRKVDGVQAGAHVNVQSDWAETDTTAHDFILNKPTKISDFDVPDYAGNNNRFLGLNIAGALAWLETGHHIVQFGTGFPSNPADNNIFIFIADTTGLTNYADTSGTAVTTASKGDVTRYNLAETRWEFEGSIDTTYPIATPGMTGLISGADKTKLDSIQANAQVNPSVATTGADGLMSSQDKTKLDSIQSGAKQNVKSDWNESDSSSDKFIENKPVIPAAQIQSDWSQSDSSAVDFIRAKPTKLEDFDLPDYAGNDGKLVAIISGMPSYLDQPVIPNVPQLTFSNSIPNNPDTDDIVIMTNRLQAVPNVQDLSGTAKTNLMRGDVLIWNGTTWIFQGAINDSYLRASSSADGLMSAADKAKLDGIESGAEANPSSATASTEGLMSAADKAKLDGIESGAEVNPGTATTSDAGLMSAADKTKLDGVATGAHVNVQADWSETDSTAQDFIRNKPTKISAFDVPSYGGNNDRSLRLRSGTPIWEEPPVKTDSTISGDGTTSSPLAVTTPFTAGEKTKLTGIADNAEVNVQADWTETTPTSDAFIRNKPSVLSALTTDSTLTGDGTTGDPLKVAEPYTSTEKTKLGGIAVGAEVNVQADWTETTPTSDAFIRNKPAILSALNTDSTLTGDGTTGDPLKVAEPYTATEKTKLGGIAAGAEVNVQADWTEATPTSDAFIRNKPAILSALNTDSTLTGDGTAGSSLSVAEPYTATERTKLSGIAAGAEVNVQSDWAETVTSHDSFIRNKPTILDQAAVDARVVAGTETWARDDTTLIPENKLPAAIARDSEITTAVAAEANSRATEDTNLNNRITGEANNRAAADNALRGRVTALENAPAPNAFNLHDDVSGELTTLDDDDRLLVSDVSEPGDPNKFIRKSNARNDLSGWLGPWSNIPNGTLLRVGEMTVHAELFWVVNVQHTKGATGPNDNSNFTRLDFTIEEYVAGTISWPQGSVVFDASGSLWHARQFILTTDPAPSDPNNRKWDRLTWLNNIPASALDADTPAKKLAFRQAIEAAGADTIIISSDTTYSAADMATLNGKTIWAISENDITITLSTPTSTSDLWFEIKAAAPYETGNVNIVYTTFQQQLQVEESLLVNWDASTALLTRWTAGGKTETIIYQCTGTLNEYISLSTYWRQWRNKRVILTRTGTNNPVVSFAPLWVGTTASGVSGFPNPATLGDGVDIIPGWSGCRVTTQSLPQRVVSSKEDTVIDTSTTGLSQSRQPTSPDGRPFRLEYQPNTIGGVSYTWLSTQQGDFFETLGNAAPQEAIVETISSDTTFDLSSKWADWKGKIVVFITSTAPGNTFGPKVTIQIPSASLGSSAWQPNSADQGDSISFHPLWENGRIELQNMKFARHDSDGTVNGIQSSSSGVNATEGLGEPFKLIFAVQYYINSEIFPWHVAPHTQDVRSVLQNYNQSVVHKPELDHLIKRVDSFARDLDENWSLPYWPVFRQPANSDRNHADYSPQTAGSAAKIVGKKGEHTIRVSYTEVNGVINDRETLDAALYYANVPARGKRAAGGIIAGHLLPTLSGDEIASSRLSFLIDATSGKMLSPLPVDVEIPLTQVSSVNGTQTFERAYRFYYYDTTNSFFNLNRLSEASVNSLGTNRLRVFGSSTDLATLREFYEDELDTGGRARIIFTRDTNERVNERVTAMSVTNVPTLNDQNRLLNSADLTIEATDTDWVPAYNQALSFKLESVPPASWAEEDSTEIIPAGKLPVGGGANNKADLVGTSASITMALDGTISPVPNSLTWTIPNEKIGDYGVVAGAFILPTERLHQAHNGWIIKIKSSTGDDLGEGICLIGSEDAMSIVVQAETGKYVELIVELEGVVSSGGIGAKIFSSASNTHGGARTAPFVFTIEIHEWIDSAVLTDTSRSGSEGGSQGAYTVLRRQEDVVLNLSGMTTDIGGSQGLEVDEGATHFEITFSSSAAVVPANITLLYNDPGNPGNFHNLYRAEGETEAATLITLEANETTTFRFSSAYFHRINGANRVRLRASAPTTMSGSVSMTMIHEKDINSAGIYPREMQGVAVTTPNQTLSANLAGSSWTEVGLATPVEWDHIDSLTIQLRVVNGLANEDSDFSLVIRKDQLDHIGYYTTAPTIESNSRFKGWYSIGWASQGGTQGVNAWSESPSAAYIYYYASRVAHPSRLIALKRIGLYLTDILVSSWKNQCIVKYVSCMRKI